MILTRQDLADWKNHPVTNKFVEDLRENVAFIQEEWANEAYHATDIYEAARLNSGALGMVRVMLEIIDRVENYEESIQDSDEEDA